MTSKHLFILPHQDDEAFVYRAICEALQKKEALFFCFLTRTPGALESIRNAESIQALTSWGVPRESIYFLGSEFKIDDGKLHTQAAFVRTKIIEKYDSLFKAPLHLWSPDWEGGHPDHDVAFGICQHLSRQSPRILHYSFPLYRNLRGAYPLFLALNLLYPKRGGIPYRYRWREKLKFIENIQFYPSQKKTWFGLLPMMIFHFLFHRTLYFRDSRKISTLDRPHAGNLFYEGRFKVSFDTVSKSLQTL